MKDDVFVYNDPEHGFLPVDTNALVDVNIVREYFGDKLIDDVIDLHGEFIIYKLVPFARISKNIELKLDED